MKDTDSTPRTATARSSGRSRIANGSALLPDVDGRSVWARLMRDTLGDLLDHCGGADRASETERITARRAAALEAELVHLEARFAKARGEGQEPTASDLDLYGRLANGQRRHLEALGMNRRTRDVAPDLGEYLARKSG